MKRFLLIVSTIAMLLVVLLPITSFAWSVRKVVGKEVEWIGQDNYFVWQQTGFKDDTTYTNDDRIIRRVITKVTRDLVHDESCHILSEWSNYDSLILKAHDLCQTIGQEHIVASQTNYKISYYIWQNWLPYEIREGKKLIARRAMVGLVALREQPIKEKNIAYIFMAFSTVLLVGLIGFLLSLKYERFNKLATMVAVITLFVAVIAVLIVTLITVFVPLSLFPLAVVIFALICAIMAAINEGNPVRVKVSAGISLALLLIFSVMLFLR